jgi:hypothetical protein
MIKSSLGTDKASKRQRSFTSINKFVIVNEKQYHTGPVLGFAEVSNTYVTLSVIGG